MAQYGPSDAEKFSTIMGALGSFSKDIGQTVGQVGSVVQGAKAQRAKERNLLAKRAKEQQDKQEIAKFWKKYGGENLGSLTRDRLVALALKEMPNNETILNQIKSFSSGMGQPDYRAEKLAADAEDKKRQVEALGKFRESLEGSGLQYQGEISRRGMEQFPGADGIIREYAKTFPRDPKTATEMTPYQKDISARGWASLRARQKAAKQRASAGDLTAWTSALIEERSKLDREMEDLVNTPKDYMGNNEAYETDPIKGTTKDSQKLKDLKARIKETDRDLRRLMPKVPEGETKNLIEQYMMRDEQIDRGVTGASMPTRRY